MTPRSDWSKPDFAATSAGKRFATRGKRSSPPATTAAEGFGCWSCAVFISIASSASPGDETGPAERRFLRWHQSRQGWETLKQG